MSKIQMVWTAHLPTEQEKNEFRVQVENDLRRDSFDRLRQILAGEIAVVENSNRTKYDNPSWAYYQAHMNGYNEAMRLILNLITKLNIETNE